MRRVPSGPGFTTNITKQEQLYNQFLIGLPILVIAKTWKACSFIYLFRKKEPITKTIAKLNFLYMLSSFFLD